MKDMIMTIVGGMGLLIFAYLLFSNGGQAVSLLNAGFSGTDTTVKVLQGR